MQNKLWLLRLKHNRDSSFEKSTRQDDGCRSNGDSLTTQTVFKYVCFILSKNNAQVAFIERSGQNGRKCNRDLPTKMTLLWLRQLFIQLTFF